MAKINNKQASAYAKPHTMGGKTVEAVLPKTNAMKHMQDTNVSVANNHSNEYPGTKTSGIKIRGTGYATKGVTARGPMA
jgi:hypothetical protein